MPPQHPPSSIAGRIAGLAALFSATDLLRLRIERPGEEIEIGRRPKPSAPAAPAAQADREVRLEAIKADLVGIFHLSRPVPAAGDAIEGDRELAFIEALGIRNPIRSRGAGRIVSIKRSDGDPVEYGQLLFEIDRG